MALVFVLNRVASPEPPFGVVLEVWLWVGILAVAISAFALSLLSGLIAWVAYSQKAPWIPLLIALFLSLVLLFRRNGLVPGL